MFCSSSSCKALTRSNDYIGIVVISNNFESILVELGAQPAAPPSKVSTALGLRSRCPDRPEAAHTHPGRSARISVPPAYKCTIASRNGNETAACGTPVEPRRIFVKPADLVFVITY